MATAKEPRNAGRVIAGIARGRQLVSPGEGTRPIGDRVKQTLFAILEPTIRGLAFLDLFAGSGAAGIEALSRGASLAVFVERDPGAVAAIERNLATTGFAGPQARAACLPPTVSSSGSTSGRPRRRQRSDCYDPPASAASARRR